MENFYQTFLNEIYNVDFKVNPKLKDSQFRKFIISEKGKSIETINLFKSSLSSTLKKPQRLIYFDHDFYMACDMYTTTYYLCYKNLLMIDIDLDENKDNIIKNKENYLQYLENFVKLHPEFIFDVYQTRKGLHLFALHKEFDYKSEETLKLMLELKTDFYYIIYSHIRGFCVRLNRKVGECDPIYKYLKRIGNKQPIPRLESLVKLHFNSLDLYSNGELCQMR